MSSFIHTMWYKLIAATLCVAVLCATLSPRLETRAAPAHVVAPAMREATLSDVLDAVDAALPAGLPATLDVQPRTQPAAETIPPLTVARTQSVATVGELLSGTLYVTFTVSNRLLPAQTPELDAGADLTATVAALQAAEATPDANTFYNVLLSDELLAGATLLSASPQPEQRGSALAWNLGDVPPLSSITVTLALSVPTAIASATALDGGAHAWGTLYNDPVDAQACPLTLWPDVLGSETLAPYLQSTVDANFRDPIVARAAGQVCSTAEALVWVQTSGYEAYKGSLRGARGTLWSEAGNSLDQSNLLVATLRSNGTPARYRHGTLDDARAEELVLSMFPTSGAVVGYVPVGETPADPLSDHPNLMEEARDHWWVEAYQDGAWLSLDPSFDYAAPGQTFAVAQGDAPSEVPADLRHTLTLRLEAERYDMLSYLLHANFTYTEPMTIAFTTAELVGQPLALKFLVSEQHPPVGCMAFCWVHYTYLPYLRVGDMTEVWLGNQFWELLSDYPFGQFAVTGLWLHMDVKDAEGHVTRYTRELADRVGIADRESDIKIRGMIPELMTAAVLEKFGPDTPALAHALDNHTLYFNPSLLSPEHAAHAGESLLAAAPRVLAAQPVSNGLADLETIANGGTLDVSGRLELAEVADTVEDTTQALNRMFAASFVALSDQTSADLAATGLVKAYPDTPRITIASLVISATDVVTQAVPVFSLDLLHDSVRVLAYPGQARSAEKAYRMTRGMTEKFLEKQVGEDLIDTDDGASIYSVAGIMQATEAQGIPLISVDAERLDVLARTDLSEEAKARIVKAVQQGYTVMVPERMVAYDSGVTIAWWQIDPDTGETLGVGEDGTHFLLIILAKGLLLLVIIIGLVLLLASCTNFDRAEEMTEGLWRYFWFEQAAQEGWQARGEGESLQEYYQRMFTEAKRHFGALPESQ